MSKGLFKQRIASLQAEVAELQSKKRGLFEQIALQMERHSHARKSSIASQPGYLAHLKHQETMLELQQAELETQLMTKVQELQQAQTAWIDYISTLPEKILVLYFAANPTNHESLRLGEEARRISEMIRSSEHGSSVKLESFWAVQVQDLFQGMNLHKPQVVHFSGHGDTDKLILQSRSGETHEVSSEALVQILKSAPPPNRLHLVFLNTCHSSEQAHAVSRHIDAAIGMNGRIEDDAARIFAGQFYSAIGFGLSVQCAFDQAKAILKAEGYSQQSDIPELHAKDGIQADELILVRPPD